MGVAVSLLASLAGLVLVALAMARHHRQLFRGPLTRRAILCRRSLGTLLLLAAPVPWALDQGVAMGLVTWIFCGLPLAGLAAVALFTLLGGPRAAAD